MKVWKGTASIKPLHSSMKVKTDEVPKIIPLSKWAATILSSRYAVFLEMYSIGFCFAGPESSSSWTVTVDIPEADKSSLQV